MRRLSVILSAIGFTACGLLDVTSPSRVPARNLEDPSRAPLLVQSAIADFECAFAVYVLASGLLTDELYSSTPFTPNAWDLRNITAATADYTTTDCGHYANSSLPAYGYGLYTPLQSARVLAENAYRSIEAFDVAQVPGKDVLLATLSAYTGYSYTVFGESSCQAAFNGGPALTGPEIFQRAEQQFTKAVQTAQLAGATSILNLALVGRARVRINLAVKADSVGDAVLAALRRADAANDARLVPPGFVFHVRRSTGDPRLENPVYYHNYGLEYVSVDPRIRTLTVSGVPDPRVQSVNAGRAGNDGGTPVWYQTKYTSRSSPIVLAGWREAQLIIAEAEQGQSAVDRINVLRASVTPPLPSFSSTDPVAIKNQVIEERRRELYLEGHRLNDRLRFGLAWETGRNHKTPGQLFRTATCLPLPDVERDNNDSIP